MSPARNLQKTCPTVDQFVQKCHMLKKLLECLLSFEHFLNSFNKKVRSDTCVTGLLKCSVGRILIDIRKPQTD